MISFLPHCCIVYPEKSPICTKQCTGKSTIFFAYSSLLPPVVNTTVSFPAAIATSKFCLIDAAYDAVENGITIPLVPKIEIPSLIPNLGLSVFGANSFPFGTEITTLIPFFSRISFPTSLKFSLIIFLGTGLIAGFPISKPKPCFVTIPTPSAPSISISFIFSVNDNSTIISAP